MGRKIGPDDTPAGSGNPFADGQLGTAVVAGNSTTAGQEIHRMLTQDMKDQIERTDDELTEFERWLLKHTIIEGREDDDDSDEDVDDDEDTDDDDSLDDDADDDDSDDDDEDDNSSVESLRQQLEEANNKRAQAEQAARKAKQEARAKAKEKAQESGDIEAIRREHEAEVADLKEQLQEAQDKATTNEFTLDQERRNNRVVKLASKLNFKDPQDALSMVDDEHTGDDKSCERALRDLAKRKSYLIDKKKGGLPMNGGGGSTLTMEDVKKMTSEQINARWDEVQGVMAASRNGG